MADKMSEWDKQLAAIDKAIERLPEEAPPAPAKAKGEGKDAAAAARSAPAVRAPSSGRVASVGVWTRLVLSAVLALAVTQWPYGRGCGVGLLLYLAVLGSVTGAGIWSAVASWRHHRGLPHVLSLVVILTGLALIANEILIRTVYGVGDLTWVCP